MVGQPTTATDLKPHNSNASVDSGYGSHGSCPVTSSAVAAHMKAKLRQNAVPDSNEVQSPVPAEELNLDALDMDYEEFYSGNMEGEGWAGR